MDGTCAVRSDGVPKREGRKQGEGGNKKRYIMSVEIMVQNCSEKVAIDTHTAEHLAKHGVDKCSTGPVHFFRPRVAVARYEMGREVVGVGGGWRGGVSTIF